MASKTNNFNRIIYLHALLGLFAGAMLSLYFHGIHRSLKEDNRDHLGVNLVQSILPGYYDGSTIADKIPYSFITLAVKFLHFFAAKMLQLRFLSPLYPARSTTSSLLFWTAFTQAVSSASDPL